jgi:hypothetical protein
MHQYNSVLYKSNEEVRLKKENSVFATTIKHADVHGRLHTSDVIDRHFSVGEVEMVSA